MGNIFRKQYSVKKNRPLVNIDKSSTFYIPPLKNVEIRYNDIGLLIYLKNKRLFEVSWKRVLRWSLLDKNLLCIVFRVKEDLVSTIVFYTKEGSYLEFLNKQFINITRSVPFEDIFILQE